VRNTNSVRNSNLARKKTKRPTPARIMKEVIEEALNPTETAGKIATLSQFLFEGKELEEFYHALGTNLGVAQPTIVVTPTVRSPTPKKLRKAPQVEAVVYDEFIYECSRFNPEVVVCHNTTKTNKFRCKNKMVAAVNYCGTPQHQLWMLHHMLTEVRPDLGLALGVYEHPHCCSHEWHCGYLIRLLTCSTALMS